MDQLCGAMKLRGGLLGDVLLEHGVGLNHDEGLLLDDALEHGVNLIHDEGQCREEEHDEAVQVQQKPLPEQ